MIVRYLDETKYSKKKYKKLKEPRSKHCFLLPISKTPNCRLLITCPQNRIPESKISFLTQCY